MASRWSRLLSWRRPAGAHSTLRLALAAAVEDHLIRENPAAGAHKISEEDLPSRKAMWSEPDLRQFLQFTQDDRLQALWRFMASTGCRRGEALGLREANIDLKYNVVQIADNRAKGIGGRPEETTPKTDKACGLLTSILKP